MLVGNTLEIEMLVQSLQAVIDARQEHDEARERYEGYSWGYHGRSYVDAAEQAAKDFGTRLSAVIDARVQAVMDARLKTPNARLSGPQRPAMEVEDGPK